MRLDPFDPISFTTRAVVVLAALAGAIALVRRFREHRADRSIIDGFDPPATDAETFETESATLIAQVAEKR